MKRRRKRKAGEERKSPSFCRSDIRVVTVFIRKLESISTGE